MKSFGVSNQWIFRGASFCLFLALAASSFVYGQGATATILGTIHDQSNAVLPGAGVTITNVETGSVRNSVTGSRGEYRVPALPPGNYEVQATMPGFQTGVRRGITLTLGQDATVNFTLQVGDVTESVTITGEAPMVEITSATVSNVVDPSQMREIPLNARSFLDLIPMLGGAAFVETADSSATKGFGRKLAISGTRYTENSFLLDGANMNDAAGSAGSADGTMAGVETVREFRVITNAYDAEYGRHTGGVISAVTKSGTNNLHGSVFEFLRNDNLDAANWADNARGDGTKPEFRRNQFGFAVGGPIARDRTFFFGSYEGLREFLGQTRTFNVPSPSARAGTLGGASVPIDPDVKPFLDSYPLPNGAITGDVGIFAEGRNRVTDHDFWAGKVDHRFSDSDSIASRFVYDDTDRQNPNSLNTGELHSNRSRFVNVELLHIFSPTLLSKTMVAFNRTNIAIADFALPGFTFPRTTFSDLTDGFGTFSVSGIDGWGGGATNPKRNVQNNYQVKQDFTYSLSSHSLKFGFHFDRFQVNQRSEARGFGTWTFGGLRDFFGAVVDQASFLRPGSDTIRGYRQNLFALYLQDDIRLTGRLTLNLGLRYEFTSTPTEVNGKISNVRDLREHFLYTFSESDVSVGQPWYLNPSLMNFAPKVGVAWDVFGTGKTSLRAGVGIFHNLVLPSNLLTWGVRMPPYFVNVFLERAALPNIDFPNTYFSQPFVREGGGLARGEGFQWNPDQPTTYKWSMDIEHELARNLSVELGYSGTRGVHLQRGPLRIIATLAEELPYQGGGTRRFIQTHRPYPSQYWTFFRWAYTDGTSSYHAVRASVNKRVSSGLQFGAAYTWSKSIDDGSNWSGSNDFQSTIRGYRDVKLRGLSAFDYRHNFSANFVYDLPGRNLTGPAKTLVAGWTLGGVVRFNSGFPLNVSMQQPRPSGVTATNVEGPSLDLIPGGSNSPVLDGGRNPDQYFDVRQFTVPLVIEGAQHGFFQGNLASNTLISPGIANFDIAFTKNTALPFLGEAGSLQFRTEFYNLLNRPNFGDPSTEIFTRPRTGGNLAGDLADPWTRRPQTGAARIDNTRTSSRQLQFGLKVIF